MATPTESKHLYSVLYHNTVRTQAKDRTHNMQQVVYVPETLKSTSACPSLCQTAAPALRPAQLWKKKKKSLPKKNVKKMWASIYLSLMNTHTHGEQFWFHGDPGEKKLTLTRHTKPTSARRRDGEGKKNKKNN